MVTRPAGFGGGTSDRYDQNNSASNDTFSIDGGADQVFDGIALFNATITYADGTTASIVAIVAQDDAGNTYLAPQLSNNAEQAALEAKPIEALTFDSVNTNTLSGLVGDRYAGSFDTPTGAVDGTDGNDLINGSFIDIDGDQITGSGNTIAAGAGNDSIQDGAGNDTIFGGSGNDRATLFGGGGNDSVTDVEVVYVEGDAGNDTLTMTSGNGYVGLDENYNLSFTSGDSALSSDGTYTLTLTGFYSFDAYGTSNLFNASNAGQGVTYYGYTGSHDVTGSNFGDTFFHFGSSGSLDLDAGGGADYIDGSGGGDTLSGGSGDDTIYGRAGNDRLEAGNNTGVGDQLYGGAGNDTLIDSYWNATLDGGDDADLIEVGYGDATVDGGEGGFDQDTLSFALGDDSDDAVTITLTGSGAGNYTDIDGDSGIFTGIEAFILTDWNDSINGDLSNTGIAVVAGAGNDTVIGSDADLSPDSLEGGDGNDVLDGRGGNDTTDGGAGDDTLSASYGSDTFIGGNGFDVLQIDGSAVDGFAFAINLAAGSDQYGNTYSGIETIIGGTQNDTLIGDSFDNRLEGRDGSDSLVGGAGNDTLVSGEGRDSLTGGAGNDSLIGNNTTAFDYTILDGGAGADTLDGSVGDYDVAQYYNSSSGVNVDLSDASTETGGDAQGDSLIGIEQVDGSNTGDDTLVADNSGMFFKGWGGNDQLIGGDGNDSIEGGEGNDYIEGGAGDDWLTTGLGQDTLMGGTGNDTLMNSDGDDSLDGGAGDDSIVATGGEDTLRGGEGADTMRGGEDADTFIIEDNFGNDLIEGGEGTTDVTDSDFDTIDLSALSGPVTITYSSDEAGTITDGTHTITFSQIERIIGTDQADVINAAGKTATAGISVNAAAGNDTIIGSDSNDTLVGGDGDDSIEMGDGDNTVVAGAGNDYVDDAPGNPGYTGNNTIDLGDGNDTAFTGYGNDTVDGGDGDDIINVQWGNDSVDGGEGNDQIQNEFGESTLNGGAGNDTITGGWDADTIDGGAGADSIDGGDGNDAINYAVGGDTVDGGAGDDTIRGGFSQGSDDAVLRGGDGNDSIVTYGADDTIDGGAGNDTINAASGNESIDGGADDDLIWAKLGDDTVDGGTGNDTIEGGRGDDSVTGGDGDDVFVYSSGDGADTITDFNAGNSGALGDGDTTNNDFIDLSGFYDNLTELREDFADDGVLNQSNSTTNGGTVDYSDNDQFQSGDSLTFQGADQSSFTADNTGVVCFVKGTRIRTPEGDRPIEMLRAGDLVLTHVNGPQEILWIGQRRIGAGELAASPSLRPIELPQKLTGGDAPLRVSPQHAVLMRVNGVEKLVRAKHLVSVGQGEMLAATDEVIYFHLLLANHSVLVANGALAESFFPGPQAMRMLDPRSRAEVFSIFPGLQQHGVLEAYGPPAFSFAKRKEVKAARLSRLQLVRLKASPPELPSSAVHSPFTTA